MVEESRRSHFTNRLPRPQSGFRDFRGTKRRAVYWRSECHEYTKTAPRVAAPSGCLRQGDMRPNQAQRGGSFVGRLTTEYTETPLATRNGLAKRRLKRKPAHFDYIYKRNEGWLRKAEGLI